MTIPAHIHESRRSGHLLLRCLPCTTERLVLTRTERDVFLDRHAHLETAPPVQPVARPAAQVAPAGHGQREEETGPRYAPPGFGPAFRINRLASGTSEAAVAAAARISVRDLADIERGWIRPTEVRARAMEGVVQR